MNHEVSGNGADRALLCIREREQARELIRQGLRIAAVQSMLRHVYRTELSRLWNEIYPDRSPPAGRLPNGIASIIKTPLDSAIASFMLNEYLALASDPYLRLDIEALSASWESVQDYLGGRVEYAGCEIRPGFFNINSVWMLARDYFARKVEHEFCQACGGWRIRCIEWDSRSKLQKCPHCTLREMVR